MRAYFLDANLKKINKINNIIKIYFKTNLDACSDLAPVITIFPELKINAVVLGSRIRIITAEKRFGLYSAFRA